MSSIFANVNGEIKEVYRIFHNDNGVIREVEVLYIGHERGYNDTLEVFRCNPNIPRVLQWVAYDGDSSTINSVTNNGYTFNASFTDLNRSISTSNKIYLPRYTRLAISASNLKFEPPVRIVKLCVGVLLFTDESSIHSSNGIFSSTKHYTSLNIGTAGYYYLAPSVFGYDVDGNVHYCTADVNIIIALPNKWSSSDILTWCPAEYEPHLSTQNDRIKLS